MKSDLRKNPMRSMGRYWLTMSDASAFMLVKSSVAVAETLRRELSDKAQVHVRVTAPELAVILLTAAEAGWGKGKASQLISQIAETKNTAIEQRSRVFLLMREAMAKLPLTLWTQDKLQARRELLEELTRQINFMQAEVPSLPSREEVREQAWRNAIAASGKRELQQRQRR